MTIRNPIEWGGAQIVDTARALSSVGHLLHHVQDTIHSPVPRVKQIRVADVLDSVKKGFVDFEEYRSDVILLCVVYAVVGLILTRLAFGTALLPLLFPLASGFAIIGPFAALALYEMSRMREKGVAVSWANAFSRPGKRRPSARSWCWARVWWRCSCCGFSPPGKFTQTRWARRRQLPPWPSCMTYSARRRDRR